MSFIYSYTIIFQIHHKTLLNTATGPQTSLLLGLAFSAAFSTL